jgi:hypothetical protein
MSTIDPIPTPIPSRDDPTNFDARITALLLAIVAFVPQTNAVAAEVNANAIIAAQSAASAVNAPGTSGTSTTSMTIATGAQAPVTQTGKNFQQGQWVTLTRTSDATKWMVGTVSSYTSGDGTMSVNVVATNGTGTFTDWTIALSAPSILSASTAAQIYAGLLNTTALTPASLFAAAAPVALADAATITPNFNAGFNFTLTLGGNRTLANPTGLKAGQSGVIIVSQDGTGNRALAVGSYFKFANGVPSLSTAANAIDLISYFVVSPTLILCTLAKAFG